MQHGREQPAGGLPDGTAAFSYRPPLTDRLAQARTGYSPIGTSSYSRGTLASNVSLRSPALALATFSTLLSTSVPDLGVTRVRCSRGRTLKLDSGRGTNYLAKITYPYLIEIPDDNVAHMGDNLKGRSIRGHYRLIR